MFLLICTGKTSLACIERAGEATSASEGAQSADASADDSAVHAGAGAGASKSESAKAPINPP